MQEFVPRHNDATRSERRIPERPCLSEKMKVAETVNHLVLRFCSNKPASARLYLLFDYHEVLGVDATGPHSFEVREHVRGDECQP